MAIVSLIGTGVAYGTNFEKHKASNNDLKRTEDIIYIQSLLTEYYQTNHQYPVQLNSSECGFKQLSEVIPNLPNDPTKGQSYCYWSDGKAWTLRYFEHSKEIVVFN